jgi:Lipid A 3-O-deacylase (PagL)
MKIYFSIPLSIALLASTVAQGQPFRKFRLGASAGLTKDNHYCLEAAYGQKWAFGARLEGYYKKDVASGFSLAWQGNYYFKPLFKKLRPYVGVGFGTYYLNLPNKSSLTVTATGMQVYEYVDLPVQSQGRYIKLGLDFQHFSLVVEYNFIDRRVATVTYKDLGYYPLPQLTKQIFMSENYLGLKLGVYLGGGLRK